MQLFSQVHLGGSSYGHLHVPSSPAPQPAVSFSIFWRALPRCIRRLSPGLPAKRQVRELRNARVPFQNASKRHDHALARELAAGPSVAHAVTKKQLNAEWHVPVDQALEMEAQAQALCMETKDFKRAYEAFAAKRTPEFQGD